MEYLFKLVNAINQYDNSTESINRLRDLVCFISDNEIYKNDDLYRSALFEAAQKMRMFGYNVQNEIKVDDVSKKGLYDIKHQTIQNYYTSKVYTNNLLDKRQKEILDVFMSLKKKRLIISAPTSFGKTFLLREIIYLNKEHYNNILLVFPTIALLNENTVSIKKFIEDLRLDYNVVNNVYSKVDLTAKNIYILTPERTLKLLSDYENLNIDFFFFDEVYKIDEDFNKDENSSSNNQIDENVEQQNSNRARAFRITLYILSKKVAEYYIAGPYLNLDNVKGGFRRYLSCNEITVKQIEFEPTLRIDIDAWKKGVVEHHPILGPRKLPFKYKKESLTTNTKIRGILTYLEENKLGQAIFYCSNPSNSMNYAQEIISSLDANNNILEKHYHFIEHLKRRYGVNYYLEDKLINTSDYWSLVKILIAGFGVHHGKFPKYVQKEILQMFNEGDINYLFCTSTIIEGVNTNAKNVVVINNSVGNKTMTSFALKNIKGRAGRYYHHFVGRVFYVDEKQRQIEQQGDMELDFSIYADTNLLKVDLDNADEIDLSINNKGLKLVRESNFDKNSLPDRVFIKNRLYQRDLQEKYLKYLLIESNFTRFEGLIGKTNNIKYFLDNHIMNRILDSFLEIGILNENSKGVYHAVVSKYSIERFRGLLEYQLNNNLKDPERDIDRIYLTVFDQIKKIIEYEIPKLLCLFESIYQQAGRLKGKDMDEFNLSAVIRFFELGVTTSLGIFLVEYGYPIDAIRAIEDSFLALGSLDLVESIEFLKDNLTTAKELLDTYEIELLKAAIQ